MRVAVVHLASRNPEKLVSLAKGLAEGLSANGAQVDIIDATKDSDKKLTPYGYIAFGISGSSQFSGKLPQRVREYLKNAGSLVGKRCFAFVLNQALFGQKLLDSAMRAMESEGMFLKYSEILGIPEEAKEIGKRLIVNKG